MTDPITIGTNGVKFIFSSDTEGKAFGDYYQTNGSSTLYTVPVDKVFWVLCCNLSVGSDYSTPRGVINANGVAICNIIGAGGEGNSSAYSIEMAVKITAGQTVSTYRTGMHERSIIGLSVWGIETSA